MFNVYICFIYYCKDNFTIKFETRIEFSENLTFSCFYINVHNCIGGLQWDPTGFFGASSQGLPSGWELRYTPEGKPWYMDHNTVCIVSSVGFHAKVVPRHVVSVCVFRMQVGWNACSTRISIVSYFYVVCIQLTRLTYGLEFTTPDLESMVPQVSGKCLFMIRRLECQDWCCFYLFTGFRCVGFNVRMVWSWKAIYNQCADLGLFLLDACKSRHTSVHTERIRVFPKCTGFCIRTVSILLWGNFFYLFGLHNIANGAISNYTYADILSNLCTKGEV